MFDIITRCYVAFNHVAARRTYNEISNAYYGITEADCKWIIKHCQFCILRAPTTTKPVITPIVSSKCIERIQIDLMDFRNQKDSEYC
jgi:hypothetical protein